MGRHPAMAMKEVIFFIVVTFLNRGIVGSSKYFLLETYDKKSIGDYNHDYNHEFDHEIVGKKSDGDYNQRKSENNGDDYNQHEVHEQLKISLSPKYLKMYNSLSKENKIKAKKRIMKDFKHDTEQVKKAAKSGKLDKYLKHNEDYFFDLYYRNGVGLPPALLGK